MEPLKRGDRVYRTGDVPGVTDIPGRVLSVNADGWARVEWERSALPRERGPVRTSIVVELLEVR